MEPDEVQLRKKKQKKNTVKRFVARHSMVRSGIDRRGDKTKIKKQYIEKENIFKKIKRNGGSEALLLIRSSNEYWMAQKRRDVSPLNKTR